jgi:hypothetical protein
MKASIMTDIWQRLAKIANLEFKRKVSDPS